MESPWKKYKEKNGITPLDLLKSDVQVISEEEQQNRYSICLDCPELLQLTKQCKKCGCFMNIKTKYANAKCPIGKW